MNKGIEILLNRMDSNPEEFINHRWILCFNQYKKILDAKDVEAFETKLNILLQDKFTEEVMKELLIPKDEPSDEGKSMGRHPIQGTGLGGQTLAPSLAVPNGGTGNITWGTLGGTGASTVIQLGNEVLDENVLRKIKRKLGI
jgi:hypothetical protein